MGLVWDTKTMFHWSIVLVFLGGVATFSFYTNNNREVASGNVKVSDHTTTTTVTATFANASKNLNIENDTQVSDHHKRMKITPPSITETCNLFSGRWVYDDKSYYPLYKEEECPYIQGDLACLTCGRNDSKYQKWRWQPHGCDFPRFDGKAIVERLKGKRLLFVGDSVNRNQWDSMLCLIHSFIPGKKKIHMGSRDHNLYTFWAKDYNISIDYYWAPMLVESNGDDPIHHRYDRRTIRIENIEKHARHWVDADILVFNSYLWWKLPIIKFLKSPGSCLDDPTQAYDEVNNVRAYKIVLETWSKWVHARIDLSKTMMFFMGPTATHTTAAYWGGKKEASCYGEKEPVLDDGFWESGMDPKMLRILDSALGKLKAKGVNVQLINITQLTQYRKDAHPTIHRQPRHPLTSEQKKNPQRASDCTHWCLPGVPDFWNEILFAYILSGNETANK